MSISPRKFDDQGNELDTDFLKAMQIVKSSGYRGYVGIEYEGHKLSEIDGIIATRDLLKRVFARI